MKRLALFLVMFFSLYSLSAMQDTSYAFDDITHPKKKMTKSKTSRINTGFLYVNNPYKVNTLCKLIQVGNLKAVKAKINEGEDINKISNKLTPLMYAARHNRVEILKLLIANGADLHAKSKSGKTALQWAKMVNAVDSYIILREAIKNSRRSKY